MSNYDLVLEFLVILGACLSADCGMRVIDYIRQRRIENLSCDICHKPRKVLKTKDKKLWACRSCRRLYNEENSQKI